MPDPISSRPATRTYVITTETVLTSTWEIELRADATEGEALDNARDAIREKRAQLCRSERGTPDVVDVRPV